MSLQTAFGCCRCPRVLQKGLRACADALSWLRLTAGEATNAATTTDTVRSQPHVDFDLGQKLGPTSHDYG